MRKIILFVLIAMIAIPSFGQKMNSTSMEEFFKVKREAYFKVFLNSQKDINRLNLLVSIDNVIGNEVIAYANEKQFADFLELGLSYEVLTNPSDLFEAKMFDGQKSTYAWDSYPTYDAYVAMMYQFATDYPEICEVVSIGQSEEGREILFAKISDNVSQDEAEPQFMYTGTMHGDETTGFVLFLRLIDYLTSNYGTDAEVTDMVNGIEIWINPAANPDGTYAGGNNTVNGATRANANSIDLNRNYKDPQFGDHPDNNAWQAETIAFMDFAEQNNFVMAANTHGGAEVVNYPWDVWPRLHPDDEWWKLVSHEYADTAQYFSPSGYLNGWDDGITNGYAWYTTRGGRQDHMNYFHHCREFILEISDVKLLPASQLEDHWVYNKRSLINYLKQSYYGARGFVVDSLTSEPLLAKVEVVDHEQDESHVFSREGQGNFHRFLKAGTYDIEFSAEGYFPKTMYDVVINDWDSTHLYVQLVSAALIADFSADNTLVSLGSSVNFNQQCFGNPDTYQWTFDGGDPATSTEPNPTVIYNEVGNFDVTLVITKDGDSQQIKKDSYISVNEEYIMSNQEITTCSGLFIDDGGVDGNYADNKDFTTTIFGNNSSGTYILEVDFNSFDLEPHANCDYDFLAIYDGVDANAPLIGKYCGTNSPGTVQSSNDSHALTFVFHSDNSENASGWNASINCSIVDAVESIEEHYFQVYPNPVNHGQLNINSEVLIQEIQLSNLNGQLLITKESNVNIDVLDVSSLPAGIYLLGVKTTSGVNHKKIQVQ